MKPPRKRNKLITIFAVAFLLMFAFSDRLPAKETVRWRVVDWPPFYILEGKDKGKGIYDELISMLSRQMPEYNHVRVVMNTYRVRRAWENGENICHPSVIPDNFSINSVVNSILLPHRLIVHKSMADKLNTDQIALEKLLVDEAFRGGITPGRYSTLLNKLIEQHKWRKHLNKHPTYENLIKMLFVKRLDYIIEYPPIIAYSAKQMGVKDPTVSLAIKETQKDAFLKVVVGCSKNAWGKTLIEKIDLILKKESQSPAYLQYRLRWYDAASRELLRSIYQREYFKDKADNLN